MAIVTYNIMSQDQQQRNGYPTYHHQYRYHQRAEPSGGQVKRSYSVSSPSKVVRAPYPARSAVHDESSSANHYESHSVSKRPSSLDGFSLNQLRLSPPHTSFPHHHVAQPTTCCSAPFPTVDGSHYRRAPSPHRSSAVAACAETHRVRLPSLSEVLKQIDSSSPSISNLVHAQMTDPLIPTQQSQSQLPLPWTSPSGQIPADAPQNIFPPLPQSYTTQVNTATSSTEYPPTSAQLFRSNSPTTFNKCTLTTGDTEYNRIPAMPWDNHHRRSLSPPNQTSNLAMMLGNAGPAGILTSTIQKRPRRKYHEVNRIYTCSFPKCDKAYGALNHLNSHILSQNHGPRRRACEFHHLTRATTHHHHH